jgi:hypothetical protein
MTTPDDANQGLYPTKGLNFQILLQFEQILQSHPELYGHLRDRCNGLVVVGDARTTQSPQVRMVGGDISIHLPDEWYAFVFLLTSAAYFDMYDPMVRAMASGSRNVEIDDNIRRIINESLSSVRTFVNTSTLRWPDGLPDNIDEVNPGMVEWQNTKSIYIAAILFIMLHEVSHIVNDDLHKLDVTPEESKEIETRCDAEAARWILAHYDGKIGASDQLGIVIALGAVVACSKNAPSLTHPEPLTRASAVFDVLDKEMTATLKLVNTGILIWVAKIAGVPDNTINKLLSGELDIDRVHGNVVEILRFMA